MKNSTKIYLPPGRAFTEARSHSSPRETSQRGAVRIGSLHPDKILERQGYLRLAQAIGISWLDRRLANLKSK